MNLSRKTLITYGLLALFVIGVYSTTRDVCEKAGSMQINRANSVLSECDFILDE